MYIANVTNDYDNITLDNYTDILNDYNNITHKI